MKTLCNLSAAFFVFSVVSTSAQLSGPAPDNPAEPSPSEPSRTDQVNILTNLRPQQLEAMAHFQRATVSRVLGIDLTVDGVLPRALKADHPLHLINPFAPAEYGSGADNLSINPRTGQAEGIVVLGIKF